MPKRNLYWCNNGCGKTVQATDKKTKSKYSDLSTLFQCSTCKEKYVNKTPKQKTHLIVK